MTQKIIELKNNQVYIINLPETASDDPLPFYDKIIIELDDKIKKLMSKNEGITKRSEGS